MDNRKQLMEKIKNENIPFEEVLKLMRKSIGVNQAKYAEITQVNINTIRGIEQGKVDPKIGTAKKLLKPFGLMLAVKPSDSSIL